MKTISDPDYIYLYDSTLRDGAQARGVDFTPADKVAIAEQLDKLGIDYVEGGWPGANPNDDAFFARPPKLKTTKLSAFGMTRRPGRSAANDPTLAAVLDAGTSAVCLVGKSWDFQVTDALGIALDENRAMIRDSIARVVAEGREAMLDAEHFFDGYKANPDYAMACLQEAYQAGARWLVLCDTNGGSLPQEVAEIVQAVIRHIPGTHLGIHCHNDTEQAVANSLAAVQAGVRQIQGTLNGVGERCGNANLISILPTLILKMGFACGVSEAKLQSLTHISRFLDERLNRPSNAHAAYVGAAAFAHKGGLHVSAVLKNPRAYEHIDPAAVGNDRQILVSDKAGRSNVLSRLNDFGYDIDGKDERIDALVRKLKDREAKGFSYEEADASFHLLAQKSLFPGSVPEFFELLSFRVIDERRYNARQQIITLSEATIKVNIGEERIMTVAEGNGPVNALDGALRQALQTAYPFIGDMNLIDYKVRILTPESGTRAITRVLIESEGEKGERWTTVGVSANVIDASFNALNDSLNYYLWRSHDRQTG